MKQETYSEKLKRPQWQKKRLEVLENAGWRCEYCDSADKTLHVHHHFYRSKTEPWEYPHYAYAALCEECHELAEMWRRELQSCIESIYQHNMWSSNLGAVIGLLKGLRMLNRGSDTEQLDCYQQAWGFSRIFSGDERDLIPLIEPQKGRVEVSNAMALWRYQLIRLQKRFELNRDAVPAWWLQIVETMAVKYPLRSAFLEKALSVTEEQDTLRIVFPTECEQLLEVPAVKQIARNIEAIWHKYTGESLWCDFCIESEQVAA